MCNFCVLGGGRGWWRVPQTTAVLRTGGDWGVELGPLYERKGLRRVGRVDASTFTSESVLGLEVSTHPRWSTTGTGRGRNRGDPPLLRSLSPPFLPSRASRLGRTRGRDGMRGKSVDHNDWASRYPGPRVLGCAPACRGPEGSRPRPPALNRGRTERALFGGPRPGSPPLSLRRVSPSQGPLLSGP